MNFQGQYVWFAVNAPAINIMRKTVSSLACPCHGRDFSVYLFVSVHHCLIAESLTEIKIKRKWFDADYHEPKPDCLPSLSPQLDRNHINWMNSVTCCSTKPSCSATVTLNTAHLTCIIPSVFPQSPKNAPLQMLFQISNLHLISV